VTVKGNQRAVCLTALILVEDGFIVEKEIQCMWKKYFRKFTLSEKCYFVLLW
jgi:hypothetical protein